MSNMEKAAAQVTVDAVLLHEKRSPDDERELWFLTVQRTKPVRGQRALPGGFVNAGQSPDEAVAEELLDETGIHAPPGLQLAAAHGSPGTDPWDEVVKFVYAAWVGHMEHPEPGPEVAGAGWVQVAAALGNKVEQCGFFGVKPLPYVLSVDMAFDHTELLMKALMFLNGDNPFLRKFDA